MLHLLVKLVSQVRVLVKHNQVLANRHNPAQHQQLQLAQAKHNQVHPKQLRVLHLLVKQVSRARVLAKRNQVLANHHKLVKQRPVLPKLVRHPSQAKLVKRHQVRHKLARVPVSPRVKQAHHQASQLTMIRPTMPV